KITASVYWTCPVDANVHELTPGRCPDGQARVKAFERRAHGDHNPRHGGQVFMADDNWHHIEGTHPSRDTVRVFFYDDDTRPMAPNGVTGTAIARDKGEKELSSVPLQRGRIARTLEARIPPSQDVRVKLQLRFSNDDHNRVFDFAFEDVTREPVQTTKAAQPMAPRAATAPVARVAPAPVAPAAPVAPVAPLAPALTSSLPV